MKSFKGKCAVLTGAANGLGRGLALALASRGTNVVIADRDATAAARTAKDAAALGVKAVAVPTDVSVPASLQSLADAAYHQFGSVQLFVSNAAVWIRRPLWQMTPEDWRWLLNINVEGVANSLSTFVPRMMAQAGEKHVVITGSTNGLWTMPGQGAYNATKYALTGIAEGLAADVEPLGMKVSLICPGPMNTEMGRRSQPPSLNGATSLSQMPDVPKELQDMVETWGMLDHMDAGRIALRGIEEEEFYIFTHAAGWDEIGPRHDRIAAALKRRAAW
jgi:NAD(P)-dependent dehydrogenase (short-subunit alcohol dehydrogenase family)